ncbi:MAG: acetate--CoA ligase family protein [Burkholderiaceae bacterium]|nr:acetate--CoA ligase family protein [Burkholderiaceae bacterium]
MRIDTSSLSRLFRPASVAVIGASADPLRIGGRPLHYLKTGGFAGAIYPINPKRDEIQGLKAYASIKDVPARVDLAIIALPAEAAVAEAAACAGAGVGSAVIFSADFAETGEAGRARQDALTDIARRSGMRILGPNCLGIFNANIGLYCTFSSTIEEVLPKPGRTAIVSQSGGYGSHLYVAARNRGVDVSYWITTGNECDIELGECLLWAAQQDDVDTILVYAEGVRSGEVLAEAFAAAKRAGKSVLFLKAGKSAAGSIAVATHTAAMTGSDAVYDAMFRQYGIARVGTTEEMVDAAYVCSRGVVPQRRDIALVTISGAMGVQMADAAEAAGLLVTEVPEPVTRRLKELTPFASPRNPVDITAQAFNDLRLVEQNLSAILDTGIYGSLLAFFTVTAASPGMAEPLRALLAPLPRRYPRCLQILSIMGPEAISRSYEDLGYLVFEEPVRAIRAIAAAIASRAPWSERAVQTPGALGRNAEELAAAARTEPAGKALFRTLGVPVPAGGFAEDRDAALQLAQQVGFPVAVKVVAPQILHKTEVGGVVLNVADAEALAAACRRIAADVARLRPGVPIEGFLVERMAPAGVETIVGSYRDPVLGPVVVFGLGGVQAEVYHDVSIRLAPIDEAEAQRMVREIKAWPLLSGFRGRPAADVDALARVIATVSRFAADNAQQVASIDINPLIVHPDGAGAVAADVAIVLGQKE